MSEHDHTKEHPSLFKFWRVDIDFDNFLHIKKWSATPNIPRFWSWNQLDILLPDKCKVLTFGF